VDGRGASLIRTPRPSGTDGGREPPGPPVPGQQLVDAVGGVIGDAGEDVREVGLRIEAVHLGGLDDRVHGGGAPATGIGAGE
jgi:hypothetical protein